MGSVVRLLPSFRFGTALLWHRQGDGKIHKISLVNVLASLQKPGTAHCLCPVCQQTEAFALDASRSCAELLIVAQRTFRLGQAPSGQRSIGDLVRQTYKNARKIDGLLGRDAFMRTCYTYATSRPDVPDHLVPSHVAKILNSKLNRQKRGRLQ